jgi:uncharacterized membrane protein YkoI
MIDAPIALFVVFLQVLELCREAGLIRLGLVALDGTKVKANAALDANRTASSVEQQIGRMLAEAEATDAREDRQFGAESSRGWVQGYNVQAVVTPDQIILAADVTTEVNDVRQLTGMLNQAQANVAAVMGEDATLGAAVADAGYWSEANAESQTEECELFIATQKDRKQRAALRV